MVGLGSPTYDGPGQAGSAKGGLTYYPRFLRFPLESPPFFAQLPDRQAWPKGGPFPRLPFLHLLDDVSYGWGCFHRGRYELRHGSPMLGNQEPFPAAYALEEFRKLSLGIVYPDCSERPSTTQPV
jgi:hypothetical protein